MRQLNAFTRTIVTDASIGLAMILTLVLINQLGQPYIRGFFCDDTTIAYPYKDNTVTSATLFAVGITLPVAVFAVVELAFSKRLSHDKFDLRDWPKKVPPCFISLYHVTLLFLFGAGATTVITEFGKVCIGRLRPHFLSVCQPYGPGFAMCQPGGFATTRYVAPDAYFCNGSAAGFTPRQLKDMRLSFPSGHASFSVYTMIFLILYLQARVVWREMRLLRGGLQTIAAMLAYLTCLSRVTDHKHHWSDVLAGSILGAVAACCTIFITLRIMPIVSFRDVRIAFKALGVTSSGNHGYDRDQEHGEVHVHPRQSEAEMVGVGMHGGINESVSERSPLPRAAMATSSSSGYAASRPPRGDVNESAKVIVADSAALRPPRPFNLTDSPYFSNAAYSNS